VQVQMASQTNSIRLTARLAGLESEEHEHRVPSFLVWPPRPRGYRTRSPVVQGTATGYPQALPTVDGDHGAFVIDDVIMAYPPRSARG